MSLKSCKTLLIPVDFSKDSLVAAQEGIQLAAMMGADVTLLHVVHDPTGDPGFYGKKTSSSKFLKKVSEIAEEMMAEFITNNKLDALAADGKVSLNSECQKGIPITQILKYAEKKAVGLVVIGASGKSKWDKLVMGSVASHMVNLSTVPVLVIRAGK